jgi:hypothetical protein
MSQSSPNSGGPATRPPTFVRITIGLFALLLLFSVAVAVLFVRESKSINTAGGWGWLLAAGILATAAFTVCVASAACAAISLWRREAHRRWSIALLIVSCLVVWAFRGVPITLVRLLVSVNPGQAQVTGGASPPMPGVVRVSRIPTSLVQHFSARGIVLRRETRYGGRDAEWIVDSANVGPLCDVVTSFVRFPRGTTADAMRNHLMAISQPSEVNEHARLAMFHPHARAKTSDRRDCEGWSGKSGQIVGQLLDAFRTYQAAADDSQDER